jgi:hypothetical protein
MAAPLAIQVKLDDGPTVPAVFWGVGPRAGTYWYTIKVGDRNKVILVRKQPASKFLKETWTPTSE